MKAVSLLLLILTAGLSGCFPMHFVDFPGVSGRVVEAGTAKPVAGAEVTAIAPMDFLGYYGQVGVNAGGYTPVQRDLHSSPTGPEVVTFGDIALERN